MQQVKLPAKLANESLHILNMERDFNDRLVLLKEFRLNNPEYEASINGYIQCLVALDIIEFLDNCEDNENA